jgi:alpha-1,3-glucan synthase
MTFILNCILSLSLFVSYTFSLPYFAEWEDYNLNQNKNAKTPMEYWGAWEGHSYTESPENWRFPFYTIFLDRFVNGDPLNDNINGTQFEVDPLSNQLRAGGDITGLFDTLDYLQGMGIKVRVRNR